MTNIVQLSQRGVLASARNCVQEAKKLMGNKQWGEAIQAYQAGLNQVEGFAINLPSGMVSNLPESLKKIAIICHIGKMQCEMYREKQLLDAGLKETVSYRVIDVIIKKTIDHIALYKLKNPLEILNWLYLYFSANESPYREANLAEAAEAFFHWAKVCRMRFLWKRMKWRNYFPAPQHSAGHVRAAFIWKVILNDKNELWENTLTIGHDFKEWLVLAFGRYATGHRGGVIRPLFNLVIIPWLIFALGFWAFTTFTIDGETVENGNRLNKFLYALSLSIYTFTGAGPGDISFINKPIGHFFSVLEVGWGYLVTVIILNQLLSTMASLTPQCPKHEPSPLDEME